MTATVTTDTAVQTAVPAPSSYAGSFLRDDLTWAPAGGGLTGVVIDLDTGTLVIDIDTTPPELVTDP